MDSEAFRRFKYSFFEDPMSARDGLDYDAVRQLQGADRERAADMLIEFLPDARGVIGLGLLGAAKAEPHLVPLFEERVAENMAKTHDPMGIAHHGRSLVYLAEALYRIRPDVRWLEALTGVLAHDPDWTNRMTAALAFIDVRDPAAIAPLTAALDDSDKLVRHHSARALLAIHGLPHDTNDNQHMVYKVMSDDIARRSAGRLEVLAAIAGRPIAPR